MKHLLVATATAIGVLACLPAAAQFRKPEAAVEYRQGAFNVMAHHFGQIGAMAAGRVPFDAAAATANADIVVVVSKLPYAGFVEGTSGTTKGSAKPTIWTERAKFDELAKKMQDEVVKLAAATKTGNLEQVKTAFGAANTACKNCHENYRNP